MYRYEEKSKTCFHSVCSFVLRLIFCKKRIFRATWAPTRIFEFKIFEGTILLFGGIVVWLVQIKVESTGEKRKVMPRLHCFGKHNPAIEDALLKLHPEIRLHFSLYNRAPPKVSLQSGSLDLKLPCIPSVSALMAHQHNPLWHRPLAQVQEMLLINTEHKPRSTKIFAVSDVPCYSL